MGYDTNLKQRHFVLTKIHNCLKYNGWMDGLRFYIYFNNISVILGGCEGDSELKPAICWVILKGCVQFNLLYFQPSARIGPGTARLALN